MASRELRPQLGPGSEGPKRRVAGDAPVPTGSETSRLEQRSSAHSAASSAYHSECQLVRKRSDRTTSVRLAMPGSAGAEQWLRRYRWTTSEHRTRGIPIGRAPMGNGNWGRFRRSCVCFSSRPHAVESAEIVVEEQCDVEKELRIVPFEVRRMNPESYACSLTV